MLSQHRRTSLHSHQEEADGVGEGAVTTQHEEAACLYRLSSSHPHLLRQDQA